MQNHQVEGFCQVPLSSASGLFHEDPLQHARSRAGHDLDELIDLVWPEGLHRAQGTHGVPVGDELAEAPGGDGRAPPADDREDGHGGGSGDEGYARGGGGGEEEKAAGEAHARSGGGGEEEEASVTAPSTTADVPYQGMKKPSRHLMHAHVRA